MSCRTDASHNPADNACDRFPVSCIAVYSLIFSFSAISSHALFHLHRPYSFLIKIIVIVDI